MSKSSPAFSEGFKAGKTDGLSGNHNPPKWGLKYLSKTMKNPEYFKEYSKGYEIGYKAGVKEKDQAKDSPGDDRFKQGYEACHKVMMKEMKTYGEDMYELGKEHQKLMARSKQNQKEVEDELNKLSSKDKTSKELEPEL